MAGYTTTEKRLSLALLRKVYGLRKYPWARRCPTCGTKNTIRRTDNVCFECAAEERKRA